VLYCGTCLGGDTNHDNDAQGVRVMVNDESLGPGGSQRQVSECHWAESHWRPGSRAGGGHGAAARSRGYNATAHRTESGPVPRCQCLLRTRTGTPQLQTHRDGLDVLSRNSTMLSTGGRVV
jgi:hypothetical protein